MRPEGLCGSDISGRDAAQQAIWRGDGVDHAQHEASVFIDDGGPAKAFGNLRRLSQLEETLASVARERVADDTVAVVARGGGGQREAEGLFPMPSPAGLPPDQGQRPLRGRGSGPQGGYFRPFGRGPPPAGP